MFLDLTTRFGAAHVNLALVAWVEWGSRDESDNHPVILHFPGGEPLLLSLTGAEADRLREALGDRTPHVQPPPARHNPPRSGHRK